MTSRAGMAFAFSMWNGVIDGQEGSCQLEGKVLQVMALEV